MLRSPVLVVLFVGLGFTANPSKSPIPDQPAQQKALEIVKEVYRDQFLKAVTAAEKLALASTLIDQSLKERPEEATRYILLRVARDIAIQAGDIDLTIRAIDLIGDGYETDVALMKADSLTKIADSLIMPADAETGISSMKRCKTFVKHAIPVIWMMVDADNYRFATPITEQAVHAATRSGDTTLLRAALLIQKNVKMLAEEFTKVDRLQGNIRSDTVDKEASLAVGKYFAFWKGDWETGLPKLANASEPNIKQAAAQDIESSHNPTELAAIGDLWWKLAENETELAKAHVLLRAAYWYEMAKPGLSGLTAAKIEKRLGETSQLTSEIGRSLPPARVKTHPGRQITNIENVPSISVAGTAITPEMITKLRPSDFAEVNVQSGGSFERLQEGVPWNKNKPNRWTKVPPFLRDNMLYLRHSDGYQGYIRFTVNKPGWVILGVSSRWRGGGSISRELAERMTTRKQFLAQGWQPVGEAETTDKEVIWQIHCRQCQAGEYFDLQTEKYKAPILFVPATGNHSSVVPSKKPAPKR